MLQFQPQALIGKEGGNGYHLTWPRSHSQPLSLTVDTLADTELLTQM